MGKRWEVSRHETITGLRRKVAESNYDGMSGNTQMRMGRGCISWYLVYTTGFFSPSCHSVSFCENKMGGKMKSKSKSVLGI